MAAAVLARYRKAVDKILYHGAAPLLSPTFIQGQNKIIYSFIIIVIKVYYESWSGGGRGLVLHNVLLHKLNTINPHLFFIYCIYSVFLD